GIRDRNVTGVQTCALPISFIELEVPLLVGELEDVQDEPIRVGERVTAENVHAERGEHTANVGKEKRLVERDDGELPRVAFALERSEERRVGKECGRRCGS